MRALDLAPAGIFVSRRLRSVIELLPNVAVMARVLVTDPVDRRFAILTTY